MSIFSKKILLNTQGNCDVQDITDKVQKIIDEAGIKTGHVIVFAVGSTSAITTIEYEPGLKSDIKDFLQTLFPYSYPYKHHGTWGDDNGSSHIQAAFIGPSIVVPVTESKMVLGTWQQIVFLDLDTRARKRNIVVQVYS